MKNHLLAVIAVLGATSATAGTNVGVSVSVGEPGFYGRIDIGNYPPPVLVYPEPVVIRAAPRGVVYQPLYLHVPPGHAKDWRKHCRHYNACGRPVYFVQEGWYNDVYVPQYRERHGDRGYRDDHPGKARGHGDHGRGKARGRD